MKIKKALDEIIFGVDSSGVAINYGFVRAIQDDTSLINLLHLRLKVFFINQVQPLQDFRSAFPLSIMTCIGIETMGEIFVAENKDDTSYQFVEIIHGYQGKGVFLSYEDTNDIEIDEEFAFLKINPDWFWNSFKNYYEKKNWKLLMRSKIILKDRIAYDI